MDWETKLAAICRAAFTDRQNSGVIKAYRQPGKAEIYFPNTEQSRLSPR
jgi:hypothetical protein